MDSDRYKFSTNLKKMNETNQIRTHYLHIMTVHCFCKFEMGYLGGVFQSQCIFLKESCVKYYVPNENGQVRDLNIMFDSQAEVYVYSCLSH